MTPSRVPRSGCQEIIGDPVENPDEVEHRWRIQEDGVALGDGEVVHHHRRGEVDVDRPAQRAVGFDHVVAQVGLDRGVAEGVHAPVRGSILGWAVIGPRSRPPKSVVPTVASDTSITVGGPASHRHMVCPA